METETHTLPHQNRSNRSRILTQIIHNLLWNYLLPTYGFQHQAAFPTQRQPREPSKARFLCDATARGRWAGKNKILWKEAMGEPCEGQEKMEREDVCSDSVFLTQSGLDLWSMQTTGLRDDWSVSPGETLSACISPTSHDEFIFPWCPEAACPLHLKLWQTAQIRRTTVKPSEFALHMHDCDLCRQT